MRLGARAPGCSRDWSGIRVPCAQVPAGRALHLASVTGLRWGGGAAAHVPGPPCSSPHPRPRQPSEDSYCDTAVAALLSHGDLRAPPSRGGGGWWRRRARRRRSRARPWRGECGGLHPGSGGRAAGLRWGSRSLQTHAPGTSGVLPPGLPARRMRPGYWSQVLGGPRTLSTPGRTPPPQLPFWTPGVGTLLRGSRGCVWGVGSPGGSLPLLSEAWVARLGRGMRSPRWALRGGWEPAANVQGARLVRFPEDRGPGLEASASHRLSHLGSVAPGQVEKATLADVSAAGNRLTARCALPGRGRQAQLCACACVCTALGSLISKTLKFGVFLCYKCAEPQNLKQLHFLF